MAKEKIAYEEMVQDIRTPVFYRPLKNTAPITLVKTVVLSLFRFNFRIVKDRENT